MDAYIKKDIAREYLHKACECSGGNGGLMLKIRFDEEPGVDVVEVVRCRDCKYHGAIIEEQPTPSIMCAHMHDNDYCSYGDRRKDGI